MWMLWLLMTGVGACLILSMFDGPPLKVPVQVRPSDGAAAVASHRIDDEEADCREVSFMGDGR